MFLWQLFSGFSERTVVLLTRSVCSYCTSISQLILSSVCLSVHPSLFLCLSCVYVSYLFSGVSLSLCLPTYKFIGLSDYTTQDIFWKVYSFSAGL
jgi:hypothetical protein